MLPSDYQDFLVAVVTASASFIGLLFVAVSFITDTQGKSSKKLAKENITAEGAYIALLDLFFVSLVALVPKTSIGHIMAIMALLGLTSFFRMVKTGKESGLRRGILGVSTVVYAVQLIYGLYVIEHSHKLINSSIFLTIIFMLFATALARAWELTGINEHK
jgi:ABC-type multidrug transport system permease subunit